jgi:hypothetical protein
LLIRLHGHKLNHFDRPLAARSGQFFPRDRQGTLL